MKNILILVLCYFVTLNYVNAQLGPGPTKGDPDAAPTEVIQTIAGTPGNAGFYDNCLAKKAKMNNHSPHIFSKI